MQSAAVAVTDRSKAGRSMVRVTIVGETMRVTAIDAPLGALLEEIAAQSGLEVRGTASLSETVRLHVDPTPFPEAIATILEDRDYMLSYVRPLAAGRSQLWIFSSRRSKSARVVETAGAGSAPAERSNDADDDRRIDALLSSDDAGERMSAAISLSALPSDAVQHQLGNLALQDADPKVRVLAVHALGDTGTVSALPILNEALSDADTTVREAAVDALGRVDAEAATLALGYALNSRDPHVRARAVDVLASHGGRSAAQLLQQALADTEPAIRAAAAGYLEELSAVDEPP